MSESLAEILVLAFLAYAGIGILVAIPFVFVVVNRVDGAARGAPIGFRVLILPGCVGLWPFIAFRWLGRRQAP